MSHGMSMDVMEATEIHFHFIDQINES